MAKSYKEMLAELSHHTLQRYVAKADRSYDSLENQAAKAYRSHSELPTADKLKRAKEFGRKADKRAKYLNKADSKLD